MTASVTIVYPTERSYALDAFAEFMEGKAALPNFTELEPARGLALLACSAENLEAIPALNVARIPGSRGTAPFARYFLFKGRSGAFNGEGIVVFCGAAPNTGGIGFFTLEAERR